MAQRHPSIVQYRRRSELLRLMAPRFVEHEAFRICVDVEPNNGNCPELANVLVALIPDANRVVGRFFWATEVANNVLKE